MKLLRRKSYGIQLFWVAIIALSSACSSDDPTPAGKFSNGAFILNEGAFTQGNASVSFYSYSGDSITNDIFFTANARPLGDVLQSAAISDGKVFLVMNGSNRIEVVNQEDFEEQGVIEGFDGPRYLQVSGQKGYVSQWGEGGKVMVVNLSTMQVANNIQVGAGPEDLLINGNDLLVANSGGYGVDSTIMVIDLATEEVTDTIFVGYNPTQLVKDVNNDIWVLCAGAVEYDESWNIIGHKPCTLIKLSGANYELEDEIEAFEEQHPIRLEINADGNVLFVGGGYGFTGIYAIDISDDEFPATPFIGAKSFYGYGFNTVTKEIYGFEAPSFSGNGFFHRYSEEGSLIDTYEVGIGPNGAAF